MAPPAPGAPIWNWKPEALLAAAPGTVGAAARGMTGMEDEDATAPVGSSAPVLPADGATAPADAAPAVIDAAADGGA